MAVRARETDVTMPYILLTPGVVDVDLSAFPTGDGKPMAENFVNQVQMIGLQYALRQLLEQQGRTAAAIGGNQFLYYNPYNRRDNLSPDVYVALDVDPGSRDAWFTWEEGKAPDIVFEITSWTTRRQDLSTAPRGKRTLYGRMGVREYYVYDPAAMAPPHLRAFALHEEGDEQRLEEAPLLPTGGVWSPLLRAELRPVAVRGMEWEPAGIYLRVIDPATGAPIRVGEEMRQDYRVARERVVALQEQLTHIEQTSQARLAEIEQGFLAFQTRLSSIEQAFNERLNLAERARLDAEEHARHAEEELARLRAVRDRAEDV